MESLKRFLLIILIPLREKWVHNAKNIIDLLPHQNDHLQKNVAKQIESTEGDRILFIFDGFDEFPKSLLKQSLVLKIISGYDYLTQATIMITSRPSAIAQLHSLLRTNIDKRVEVVGFSDKEIQLYAQSNLEGTLYDDFIDYLSVNPAIKGMMYNPLNSAIIVEAYRESHQSGRPIPYTQTELYTQLALYRMSRYFSERGLEVDNLPNSLLDVEDDSWYYFLYNVRCAITGGTPYPRKVKQQLFSLGKQAFHARVVEEVIFKSVPGTGETLGLLMKHTSLYGRNDAEVYTFIHLTLQEYLGAFYLALLPVEEQKQHFRDYSNLKQMNIIWRFFAGLTKMHNVGWDIFQDWKAEWIEGDDFYTYKYEEVNEEVIVQPFIIQCLYEAQEAQSCSEVFGQLKVKYPERVFNPYQGLTNYDIFALGYSVSLCSNEWNIGLKLTDLDLDMLGYGMSAVDESGGGYIKILDLWGSNVTINQEKNLLRMPDRIIGKIESLNLRGCGISDSGIESFARSIPSFQSLTSLNISYNPLSPGSTVNLLMALQKHRKLKELHYRGLVIDLGEVYALSNLIQTTHLQRLCVGESYTRNITFSADVLKQLIKTIFMPSSLESIYLRTNPLTKPLEHIETISKTITTLQFTSFYEVSSNDGIQYTTTNSQSESVLKSIKGGTKLSKILGKNSSLKELWLELSLDDEEVHSILWSLRENTALEKIVFYRRRHLKYLDEEDLNDPRIVVSDF